MTILRAMIAALALASIAHAGTSIITGQIKDAQGNPVNGTLVMRLPIPAQDPTTQSVIAPVPVTFKLINGQVTGGAPLYDLQTIQPSKLWYSARAYDTTGALVFYGNYFVTGSTFNIGAASPTTITTSNISFSNLSTGIVSINGDTTQGQTIVGSGGITASTSSGRTTINGSGISGGPGQISIASFGAVSDATTDSTCSMDGSTAILTCTDAPFSVCPSGKVISVNQALARGGFTNPQQLITTVSTCSSTSVAVLNANSTNATGANITAIWGTDNYSFIAAAATAAVGQTLVFPPGNYLFKLTANMSGLPINTITTTSGSSYWIQPGATIYDVNVSGADGVGSGSLFNIPDHSSKITIRIDGIITGENTSSSYLDVANQSAAIFGNGSAPTTITDIQIYGTGQINNQYGFTIHDPGSGQRWSISGLTFTHNGNSMNVNADYTSYHDNQFINTVGIETSGAYSNISRNHFSNTGGQYVISLGGRTALGSPCFGTVVDGNTIDTIPSTSLGGISLSSCTTYAVISSNTIGLTTGNGITLSPGANAVSNNILANNVIQCNAAGSGILVSGGADHTKIIGNKIITQAGAAGGCGSALNVTGSDATESYSNTYQAAHDISISGTGNTLVQLDHLIGSQNIQNGGGGAVLDPASIWSLLNFGVVMANNEPIYEINGTNTGYIPMIKLDSSSHPIIGITGTNSPGQAACFKTDGSIGWCSTVVGAGGACTCN